MRYIFTVCTKRGCGFSSAHELNRGLSRDGRFAIYHCADGHVTRVPIKWLKNHYPEGKAR